MTSFDRIVAIAHNTLREAIRSRVLYTLGFFALAMIGTGVLLSSLSYVERGRILQDVGLASVRIFSVAIAIFVGVGLVHREVDRRTVFTILSKPIRRSEFLLGKYLGLVATLLLQLLIMAAGFVAVSLLAGAPVGPGHAAALLGVAAEAMVVTAVALLFSSFTTPMLASLFTAGIWAIGRLSRDLRALGEQSESQAVAQVTEALYRVLPDLEAFDLSTHAVHQLPLATSDVVLPLLYATGYVILTLLIATAIFERRDFR